MTKPKALPLESKNSETPISANIRLESARLGTRLFRNQVGLYKLIDGRTIRSGLAVGSSDLIGWTPVEITPEMVGKTIAVFTSIEVKSAKAKPTSGQNAWLAAVKSAGGIGGIARSVDDFREIVKVGA